MTLHKNRVCIVSYGDDSQWHMYEYSVEQGEAKRAYQ